MNGNIPALSPSAAGANPQERSQALAEARQRVSQGALQKAEAAELRRADSFRDAQAIIERAIGANTRLSVARKETTPTFVYRAIDIDTGEVIREWPPADFAKFMVANGGDLATRGLAGAIVNEKA